MGVTSQRAASLQAQLHCSMHIQVALTVRSETPLQNSADMLQLPRCRDIAARALNIVQREAQRHSAVRSQLAGMEGLQAAALFQEGLREPPTPGQLPCTGEPCTALCGLVQIMISDRTFGLSVYTGLSLQQSSD